MQHSASASASASLGHTSRPHSLLHSGWMLNNVVMRPSANRHGECIASSWLDAPASRMPHPSAFITPLCMSKTPAANTLWRCPWRIQHTSCQRPCACPFNPLMQSSTPPVSTCRVPLCMCSKHMGCIPYWPPLAFPMHAAKRKSILFWIPFLVWPTVS